MEKKGSVASGNTSISGSFTVYIYTSIFHLDIYEF